MALHDHGGFYLWGKEKLVELPGEHPVLTDFKKQLYAGRSIASELARGGYVVAVIDMFYWGERRMLLADDPADWRNVPRPHTRADRGLQPPRRRVRAARRSDHRAAGFTWPGVMFWDDIRTLDYLPAGRRSTRAASAASGCR